MHLIYRLFPEDSYYSRDYACELQEFLKNYEEELEKESRQASKAVGATVISLEHAKRAPRLLRGLAVAATERLIKTPRGGLERFLILPALDETDREAVENELQSNIVVYRKEYRQANSWCSIGSNIAETRDRYLARIDPKTNECFLQDCIAALSYEYCSTKDATTISNLLTTYGGEPEIRTLTQGCVNTLLGLRTHSKQQIPLLANILMVLKQIASNNNRNSYHINTGDIIEQVHAFRGSSKEHAALTELYEQLGKLVKKD